MSTKPNAYFMSNEKKIKGLNLSEYIIVKSFHYDERKLKKKFRCFSKTLKKKSKYFTLPFYILGVNDPLDRKIFFVTLR